MDRKEQLFNLKNKQTDLEADIVCEESEKQQYLYSLKKIKCAIKYDGTLAKSCRYLKKALLKHPNILKDNYYKKLINLIYKWCEIEHKNKPNLAKDMEGSPIQAWKAFKILKQDRNL